MPKILRPLYGRLAESTDLSISAVLPCLGLLSLLDGASKWLIFINKFNKLLYPLLLTSAPYMWGSKYSEKLDLGTW